MTINGVYRQGHRFAERRRPEPPYRQRLKMLLCEAGYPEADGVTFRPDDMTDRHVPSYSELTRAHLLAGWG